MKNDLTNKILIIVYLVLSLVGVALIIINIFSESLSNTYLNVALICIILSNLLNLIRIQRNKKLSK